MKKLTKHSIETERFRLREVAGNDIRNIHRGLSDPKVVRYYGVYFPSLEDTKEQMTWFADLRKNATGIWFCIISKATGDFCGACGFNNLDKTHKRAETGFWLLPEFWKMGIMRESMPALLNFGFEKLGLNRIEAFVESENINCKKAIEHCNFKLEGSMRQYEVKNGKYIDVDIYSKLKSD